MKITGVLRLSRNPEDPVDIEWGRLSPVRMQQMERGRMRREKPSLE